MMRLLRYLAFALGGIAALVVAAAIFIIATFDADRVKSEITQIVKDKKQRTLKVEGNIQLSFWPALGVKFGQASLSEHASEKEFAALEAAQLSLALLPLLEKRVVIDKLAFDGVKATIIRRKDGSLNIDDLLASENQDSETLRFDIAGMRITNSQLDFRDEQLGRRLGASGIDLAIGRLGNAADGKLALKGRLVVDRPTAAVDVVMGGTYRYDLDRNQYAVSAFDARVGGAAAGVESLDLRLSAGALQFKKASGEFEIEIERLDLVGKGKRGEEDFEVGVDAPMLVLTANRAISQTATLALKLGAQRHSLDARMSLAGIEGSTKALKIGNARVELDARQSQMRIKGGLNTALAADLAARTLDMPTFTGAFNLAHPDLPVPSVDLPVSGSLHVDIERRAAAGDISAKLDESTMRAHWSVPRFVPLALDFDAEVDRINVDRYLPPRPRASTQRDKTFDFAALRGVNANGTLKIGVLRMSNVKADNIRLDIRAMDGRLEVGPIGASLYGGRLAGRLAIDAKDNKIALSQTLSGVSVNPLLKDLADHDLIAGHGDIVLDLASAGATLGAIKRGLSGTARVSFKDGVIKGIDLVESARAARASAAPDKPAALAANGAGKTDFSELSASFRIAEGVARTDDLAARSPVLRIIGNGSIDLAEGSMDYVATARIHGAAAVLAGKQPADPRGVSLPLRVSGPFGSLRYELTAAPGSNVTAKVRVDASR